MTADLHMYVFDPDILDPVKVKRYFMAQQGVPETEEFFDPIPTAEEIFADPTAFHEEVWVGKTLFIDTELNIQGGTILAEHVLGVFKAHGGAVEFDSFVMAEILHGYRLEHDAFMNPQANSHYHIYNFIFNHVGKWAFVDIRREPATIVVMNTDKALTKLSKTMAYMLRHHPEEFSLPMNEAGWVSVSELAKALTSALKTKVTVQMVEEIVANDEKQRYTLQGQKVRAAQGHSFPIKLGHPVLTPPATLFHGTATHALKSIMNEGLKPGSRHSVHLSASKETAETVGSRHGTVVVLEVNAAAAHASGIEFRLSENNVWLVETMPAEFLTPLW